MEATHQLQFDRAEFSSSPLTCSRCSGMISSEYFLLSDQKVCASCAEITRSTQQSARGASVLRAVAYGAAAAAGCSAVYALITYITHMELALISILVGYVIGRAVRKGSNGLGGRRLQVASVVLTYLAITGSYVPMLFEEIGKITKKVEAAPTKTTTQVAVARKPVPRPVSLAVTIFATAVMALAFPIIELTHPLSGALGLVILYFGLSRAWRETARDSRLLMGPYAAPAGHAGA